MRSSTVALALLAAVPSFAASTSKSTTHSTTKSTSKTNSHSTSTSKAKTTAFSSVPVPTTVSTTTPSAYSTTSVANPTTSDVCYVTAFADVPAATAACTSITLDSITIPGNSTLDLSKLKTGTTVTFAGTTTLEFFEADYDPIKVGGTDITITAEPDAIIDGNGEAWWDGQGSNGGIEKPDHFVRIPKGVSLGAYLRHQLTLTPIAFSSTQSAAP